MTLGNTNLNIANNFKDIVYAYKMIFHTINQCINIFTSTVISSMVLFKVPVNFICKVLLSTLTIDTIITKVTIPCNSKKDSIIFHHLYTIALLTIQLLQKNTNIVWDRIVKLLIMYELSTPIVCFHNILPNIFNKKIRNILWCLIRIPLFFYITRDIFILVKERPSLELAYIIPIVFSINAFTLAWTTGYKNSSLFLYASCCFISMAYEEKNHLFFSLVGFFASFLFYTFEGQILFKIIDQFIITTHCFYYLTSICSLSRTLGIIV